MRDLRRVRRRRAMAVPVRMGVAVVGVIVEMRVCHGRLLYYNITRVHKAEPSWLAGKIGAGRVGRQSDGLAYTLLRQTRPDGTVSDQRQDQDLWIERRPDWGCVARDAVSQSCTGTPWNAPPADQGDHPPAGGWVSRKGPKSHVYRLVYVSLAHADCRACPGRHRACCAI